jgi:regulator of replication initiation timing
LLFNSCSDIINKVNQTGFKNFIPELIHFLEERKQRIHESNIVQDINKIEENLKQYRKQYKGLKNIKNKTLEQQAEKVLLKEEIKELKERLSSLQKILNGPTMSGGDIEQYYQGQPQIQEQMNANPIIINYAPPMPYYSQKRLPYNVSLNKAKDIQSKLSFYTNVELELFPGTSVNPLQRGLVKCQNTFERIREAWADIFGYQYRPAPMTEAYQYQTAKKPDSKDNTNLEIKKIE